MICRARNCKAEAVCSIALRVPAMGCPIAEHEPLKMVIGLGLCAACFEAEKGRVSVWANMPDYRAIFEIAARGKARPDFARAFIEPVPFESAEWKALTGCSSAGLNSIAAKSYTADLIPEPDKYDRPIEFTVSHNPEKEEAWTVSSDIGCTTHRTLDEALFWELVMDGRHITEQLREAIVAEWEALTGGAS